ncbi:MAG: hypothetical protein ACREVO_08230 [Steroidobacteraceae bacterium]
MPTDTGAATSVGATSDFAGDIFLDGPQVLSQTGQISGFLATVSNVIDSAGTLAYGYNADTVSCAPICRPLIRCQVIVSIRHTY